MAKNDMVMITKKESEEAILALEAIMSIQRVVKNVYSDKSAIIHIKGILGNLEKELKK